MGLGLFGHDIFYYNNQEYIAARGLQRLVKFISEGKAKYFEIPRYNLDVEVGIYWLVMIRKVLRKGKKSFYLLDRIFQCAKQMGETEADDFNGFFKELRGKYPDFDYHDLGSEGAVKWIAGRYIKAVRKNIRSRFNIKSHDIPINEDDTLIRVEIDHENNKDFKLNMDLIQSALDQIRESKTQAAG